MKTLQRLMFSFRTGLNPQSSKVNRGTLLLFIVFAGSTVYAGQPAPGVAGVEVVVKQSPAKRAVTDARGNFVLDALPSGSYMLV
ncbi:MAG TPA: hypothetical protein VII34_06220, partial [Pyrinomonadaceae bacterium]